MGKTIVVTGAFSVSWDADDLREDLGEALSDGELLEDCKLSVEQDWEQYALHAEAIHVEADLIG